MCDKLMQKEAVSIFSGDSYKTPKSTKRFLFDRLLFGSRWAFYIKNFIVYYRTGQCGKKGKLDTVAQAYYSRQNMKVAEGCGARISVSGMNNIDKVEGPVVFIGNHMSLLETAVMSSFISCRKPAIFVVKEKLFNIPFFGNIMRGMGNIGVARENPREDFKKVISEGKKKLEAGESIIIYPQSTRSAQFDPSQFNSIGVKLAKGAGVPVIPVALKTDFLENGKKFKDLGPINKDKEVHFEFAEAIEVTGNGKEAQNTIVEFITSRLEKWGK